MVGILVVSHGGLAEAMVRAGELIAGKCERFYPFLKKMTAF